MSTRTSVNSKGGSIAKRLHQVVSTRFTRNDFYGDDLRTVDIEKLYESAAKKVCRKPQAHVLLFMENKFKCAAYKVVLEQSGFVVTHCFRSRDVFAKHLRNFSTAFDAVLLEWECNDVRGRDVVSYYEHAFPEYPLLFIALVSDNYPPSMAVRGGADLFFRMPLILHVPVLRQLLLPQVSVSVKFPSHTLAATPAYKKIADTLGHMSQQNTKRSLDELNSLTSDIQTRLSQEESEFLTEHEAAMLVKNVAKMVAPTGKFRVQQHTHGGGGGGGAGGGGDDDDAEANDGDEGAEHRGGTSPSSTPLLLLGGGGGSKKVDKEFEERVQQLVAKRKKKIKYSVDFQFLQDIVGAAKMMKSRLDEVQAENKILRKFVRKVLDITPRPKKKDGTAVAGASSSSSDDDDNNSNTDQDGGGDHTRAEKKAMNELKRDQAVKNWLSKSTGGASSQASSATAESLQLPLSVLAALAKYSTSTKTLREVTAADGDLIPKSKLLENALSIQDRLFQVEAELSRTLMALKSTKALEGAIRSAVKKMTAFRDPTSGSPLDDSFASPASSMDRAKDIHLRNAGGLRATPPKKTPTTTTSPSTTPRAKALGGTSQKERPLLHHQVDRDDDDDDDDDRGGGGGGAGDDSDDTESDFDEDFINAINWHDAGGPNSSKYKSTNNGQNHPQKTGTAKPNERRRRRNRHQHHHQRASDDPNFRTIAEILEERLMFNEDASSQLFVRSGAIEPVVFRHRWIQDRPLVNPTFINGFDEISRIMNKVCVILNDLSIRVATLYPPCRSRFVECSNAFKGIVDEVRWELVLSDDYNHLTSGLDNPSTSPLMKKGLSFMRKNGAVAAAGNEKGKAHRQSSESSKSSLEQLHRLRVAKVRGARLARNFAEKLTIRRVIDVWYAWLLLRRQQRVFNEEKNDMKRMQYILSNVKLEKAQKEKLIEGLLAKATARDNMLRARDHPKFGGGTSLSSTITTTTSDEQQQQQQHSSACSTQPGAADGTLNSSSPTTTSSTTRRQRPDSICDLLEMIQNHENEDDFSNPFARALNQVNRVFEQRGEKQRRQEQGQERREGREDEDENNNNNGDEDGDDEVDRNELKRGDEVGSRELLTASTSKSKNAKQARLHQRSQKTVSTKDPSPSTAAISKLDVSVPQTADVRVLSSTKVTSKQKKSHQPLFDVASGSQKGEHPQHQRNRAANDDEYGIFDSSVGKSMTDDHIPSASDHKGSPARREKQSEFGHNIKGGKWSFGGGGASSRNANSDIFLGDGGYSPTSRPSPTKAYPAGRPFDDSPHQRQQEKKSLHLSKEEQARLIARLTQSTAGSSLRKIVNDGKSSDEKGAHRGNDDEHDEHDEHDAHDEHDENENDQDQPPHQREKPHQRQTQIFGTHAATSSSHHRVTNASGIVHDERRETTWNDPGDSNLNSNANANPNPNNKSASSSWLLESRRFSPVKKVVSFGKQEAPSSSDPPQPAVAAVVLHTVSLGDSSTSVRRRSIQAVAVPPPPPTSATSTTPVSAPLLQQRQQQQQQLGSPVQNTAHSPLSQLHHFQRRVIQGATSSSSTASASASSPLASTSITKPRPVMNFDALTGTSLTSSARVTGSSPRQQQQQQGSPIFSASTARRNASLLPLIAAPMSISSVNPSISAKK